MEAAKAQKLTYDHQARTTNFYKGDSVWLSIPTAGNLSPHWEGGWTIQEVKSAVTMKITNGYHSKVVHVNRLRHRIQKQPEEIESTWVHPEIEHLIIPSDPPERCYPLQDRHPPDHLQF